MLSFTVNIFILALHFQVATVLRNSSLLLSLKVTYDMFSQSYSIKLLITESLFVIMFNNLTDMAWGTKQALKTYISSNRTIIIKPCDKGAGTIICVFEKYNKSCLDHLDEKLDGDKPYSKKLTRTKVDEIKSKIYCH